MTIICTFLSIASVKRWEIHQIDVHNVFLHGDLEEEVLYTGIPPCFEEKGFEFSLQNEEVFVWFETDT